MLLILFFFIKSLSIKPMEKQNTKCFLQQERYGFLVTVKTIFNIFLRCIIIFGVPYWLSWIIFIVSQCVSNVRVRSFFWSVFFRKIKTLYLCTFLNYLPYLPEIEIKLQIALTEINHKWANLVLSLRFSKQLVPSIMAKL